MSGALPSGAFWMVWNPRGRAPQVRHPSLQEAVAEAERLAREHAGQTFIVLESVSAMRVDDIVRVNLRPGSDIPF